MEDVMTYIPGSFPGPWQKGLNESAQTGPFLFSRIAKEYCGLNVRFAGEGKSIEYRYCIVSQGHD